LNNDIYATPKSAVAEKAAGKSPILVYSPTQVACGTIGGPVGLIYFLMSNFEALEQKERKKNTLLAGIAFIVVLIALVPFLPENFPNISFTIAYIIIAHQVAEKYQMTKADIMNSGQYDFHSNWRVLGIGLLCMLASVVIIMGSLMLLMLTGIWVPA
jgi:uncharacterized membrane protein